MTLRDGMFAESTFAKVRLSPHEAEPLPHWAYTSQAWYDREQERIFRAQWNYVGHASQIPIPATTSPAMSAAFH